MKIQTFALIIGVSKYQSNVFDPLPAAQADALHFARALVGWGIPETHITLICSNSEKKETFERCLQKISAIQGPFQLLFYFCGHGYRTPRPKPESFLIFSDSEIEGNECKNGVNLEKLLHELIHLNTTSSYIFIDACNLRFNSIMNPKLKEEIQGKKDSKKNLFCLLSSGIFPSFECVNHQYGYFTEALIRALSEIRQKDRSPISLFQFIQRELQQNELPEPEMYNIGIHSIDFFPSPFFYMKNDQLVRQEILGEIQDCLVRNRNQTLFMIGPKGIGKTTLAQQLSSNLLQIYLIFVNNSYSILRDQILHSLIDSQLLKPNSSLISLEDYLNVLDIEKPYSLLIFDNVNEKEPQQLKEILELFAKKSFRAIFLSNDSYFVHTEEEFQKNLIEYLIPPLTFEETALLIKESNHLDSNNIAEIHHLITKGNPQKLKHSLYKFKDIKINDEEIEGVRKAIAATYSCGLFINEELFRKIFSIEIKALALLEKIGLISYENGCWRLHDFLIEIAESEQVKIDRESTLLYWCNQLEELPGHFESALYLVLTMQCFGYESKFDRNLLSAFQILYDHKSKALNVLKDSITIFDRHQTLNCDGNLQREYLISPSSLFLAEILLEMQEFNLVRILLGNKKFSNTNQQTRLTYCHLLWRTGLFSECIKETTSLIQTLSSPSEKVLCYLHRGASHYFLGNWEAAKTDCSFINQNAQDPKYIGWSRCLLGTIAGIRGIDVNESKELIESGIRILTKSEDLIGSWIGWNNLGELMWKAGELRSSDYYLQKALEISEKANNISMLLETLRNLLQLELRRENPDRSKINKLLDRIEQHLEISIETFEAMQLYNTLCTVYHYLKNHLRAQYYLKKAIPLTIKSKEYHIYTLSNLSLICKAYCFEDKSAIYFQRAIKLAKDGNNLFAAKQIESDHMLCFRRA